MSDGELDDDYLLRLEDSTEEQMERTGNQLLEYGTPVPGPGAYEILPAFGAMPKMPTAKYGGAFTFSCRKSWVGKLAKLSACGPGDYTPQLRQTISRKPAWGFGTSSRGLVTRMGTPGPGSYELSKPNAEGPRFSMRPRRGLHLHPSQRFARTPERSTPRVALDAIVPAHRSA